VTTARTPCEEIAAESMGLVPSPPEAPERRGRGARAHLRGLRGALAEARRLLAMLERLGPAAPPGGVRRASAAVLTELEHSARPQTARGRRSPRGAVPRPSSPRGAAARARARGPSHGQLPSRCRWVAALRPGIGRTVAGWARRRGLPLLSAVTGSSRGSGRGLDARAGSIASSSKAMTPEAWRRGLARAVVSRPGPARAAPALVVAAVAARARRSRGAAPRVPPRPSCRTCSCSTRPGRPSAVALALVGTARRVAPECSEHHLVRDVVGERRRDRAW